MQSGRRLHRAGAPALKAWLAPVHGLTPAPCAGMLLPARSTTLAFDPKSLEELAHKLAGAVPPGLSALRDDLERNFRAILQSGLARLDLVTRQEFDIQAAVLRRSRERLEELERRIAALEKTPQK
jgi:BMFP domain-containing protein YqiC